MSASAGFVSLSLSLLLCAASACDVLYSCGCVDSTASTEYGRIDVADERTTLLTPLNAPLAHYSLSFLSPSSVAVGDVDGFVVHIERYPGVGRDHCKHGAKTDEELFFRQITVATKACVGCSHVNVTLCMRYWVGGCYYFDIKAYSGENYVSVVRYLWISDDHTLQDFAVPKPYFKPINTRELFIANWTFPANITLNDEYRYNVKLFHKDIRVFNFTESCFLETNNTIICQIGNLSVGNYTIGLELTDNWRCYKMMDPVYGSCYWKDNITIERWESLPLVPTEINRSYEWYGGILTGLIIFILCMFSLFSWIYFQRKRSHIAWQKSFENEICTNNECQMTDKNAVKGIFLIYARDCDLFMDLMINFRNLLSKMTGCKVYDLYDDSLFNEISISPHEWVQYLIQNPQIKVVLVATECADILYKSLMRYYSQPSNNGVNFGHMQYYHYPNFLDSLVIHALKLTSFDITPTPYHKYFVVRFSKFSKQGGYLCHINPFKRFDLPDCLDALKNNILEHSKPEMNGDLNNSYLEVHLKENNIDKIALIKCIKSLQEYVRNNPLYLTMELLNTEVICEDIFKNNK